MALVYAASDESPFALAPAARLAVAYIRSERVKSKPPISLLS